MKYSLIVFVGFLQLFLWPLSSMSKERNILQPIIVSDHSENSYKTYQQKCQELSGSFDETTQNSFTGNKSPTPSKFYDKSGATQITESVQKTEYKLTCKTSEDCDTIQTTINSDFDKVAEAKDNNDKQKTIIEAKKDMTSVSTEARKSYSDVQKELTDLQTKLINDKTEADKQEQKAHAQNLSIESQLRAKLQATRNQQDTVRQAIEIENATVMSIKAAFSMEGAEFACEQDVAAKFKGNSRTLGGTEIRQSHMDAAILQCVRQKQLQNNVAVQSALASATKTMASYNDLINNIQQQEKELDQAIAAKDKDNIEKKYSSDRNSKISQALSDQQTFTEKYKDAVLAFQQAQKAANDTSKLEAANRRLNGDLESYKIGGCCITKPVQYDSEKDPVVDESSDPDIKSGRAKRDQLCNAQKELSASNGVWDAAQRLFGMVQSSKTNSSSYGSQ